MAVERRRLRGRDVTVERSCSLDSTSRRLRSDGDLGWIWQDVTQLASHFGIPDAVRDACNAGGKRRRGLPTTHAPIFRSKCIRP